MRAKRLTRSFFIARSIELLVWSAIGDVAVKQKPFGFCEAFGGLLCAVTSGTPSEFATAHAANQLRSDVGEVGAPFAESCASLRTRFTVCGEEDALSATLSLTFLPRIPPWALIQSTPISRPCVTAWP